MRVRASSQAALERKKLPRFGEAARQDDADMFTVQSREDIPFERTNLVQKTEAEKQVDDIQQKLNMVTSKKEVVSNLKELLAKKRLERQLMAASGESSPTFIRDHIVRGERWRSSIRKWNLGSVFQCHFQLADWIQFFLSTVISFRLILLARTTLRVNAVEPLNDSPTCNWTHV